MPSGVTDVAQRALLTDTEREILSGERDVKDNYRYSVESRVRSRIHGPLVEDLRVIRENYPEMLEAVEEAVFDVPDTEPAEPYRDGPPRGPDDLAPGEDPPETLLSDDQEAMLRERLAGSGAELDGRVDAVGAMYARLRALGEADKDELLGPVNVEATGYAHAESVWSNVVKGKDTLAALPGVEKPGPGMATWRYSGEEE